MNKFLGGLESHAGREYFGGLVRMSQSQYLQFTSILEIMQFLYVIGQMVYFFLVESEIGGIDLIMNFLVTYLVLCNFLPLLLIFKTREIYKKIENCSPAISF